MRLTIVFAVAVFSAAGAAAWIANVQPKRMLAEQLQRELDQVPDADVLLHLRNLGKLGEEALPPLVDALAHPRPVVAEAAEIVLNEQLEQWRRLTADQSSRQVAVLARLLARRSNADSAHSGVRGTAARLASKILLWPIDRQAVDGPELVENCAAILHTGAATVALDRVPEETDQAPQAVSSRTKESLSLRRAAEATSVVRAPAEPVDEPSGARVSVREKSPSSMPNSLFEVLQTELARQPPPDESSAALYRGAPQKSQPLALTPKSDQFTADEVEFTLIDAGSIAELLRQREDFDVMRYLQSEDPTEAIAAELELRRRGYRGIELHIAARVVHPDASVRLRLAEQLPGMRGVDARSWLLKLARDEDPRVRAAAISILATSRDPALLRQLEALDGYREADRR